MRPELATKWPDEPMGKGNNATANEPVKRPPLTLRNAGEIVAMHFDDAELILGNGYLVAGERTAICGMGGIGKSRWTMQLALCCCTGRDFLGWQTNGRRLRWLFLQTENSCRRLQYDISRMLTAFSLSEAELIGASIFFHTLEGDEDGFLMLDSENIERIAEAIERCNANVCVFDPLRDFGCDDLNSDRHMAETLREISRVTRRGDVKRVPLVVHHAGTGKTGIQKAIGFDRSSFGRNSKVLFSWARAQINIAPALADDNDLIIIAPAKCNNSAEFEPFAARLNIETMLYEREDDFDVHEWRQSLDTARDGEKITPDAVLDLLPATGSIEKSELLMRLGRAKGIGEKKARRIAEDALAQGLAHEWRLKRSGKRDEIHLSRHAQIVSGSVTGNPAANNANNDLELVAGGNLPSHSAASS
jgi:hypothetical protein